MTVGLPLCHEKNLKCNHGLMRFGNGQIGTVDMHMSPTINDSDMTKPEVWEPHALIIIFRCRLPFLKNHILDMHLTVRSRGAASLTTNGAMLINFGASAWTFCINDMAQGAGSYGVTTLWHRIRQSIKVNQPVESYLCSPDASCTARGSCLKLYLLDFMWPVMSASIDACLSAQRPTQACYRLFPEHSRQLQQYYPTKQWLAA